MNTFKRLKELREAVIAILLGSERVVYPPNQFKSLSADVAEVLSRNGGTGNQPWIAITGGVGYLSDDDETMLQEVVEDLKREGVLIDGMDSLNPTWPFFRLTSRAEEILKNQKSIIHHSFDPSENVDTHQEEPMSAEVNAVDPPRVFISYSWDDEVHKKWVREFAARLRADAVDATLDQWHVAPGDRLPHFMERAVRENSFVLIICTQNYKEKSNGRKGGVGYEGDIMTAEVYAQGNHRKYIPVLRHGDVDTAVPSWLSGKYHIDLSTEPFSESQYQDLLNTLHNRRDQAPPIGTVPNAQTPIPVGHPINGNSRTSDPFPSEAAIAEPVGNVLSDRERLENLAKEKEQSRQAEVEKQKLRQIENTMRIAEVIASEKAKTQEVLKYCKQNLDGFRLVPTGHEIHVDTSSCSVLHGIKADEVEYVCLNISHWSHETGDFQGLIPILLTRFRQGGYQLINAEGKRLQYKTIDGLKQGLIDSVSDLDRDAMSRLFAIVRSRLARR